MTTLIRRLCRAPMYRMLGALLLLLLFAASPVRGQDMLQKFEKKTTTFTLDNGLDFVIVERHDAPVASFATYVDVGSVNEPEGKSGVAHMFEHMAFKGTTTIGTKNIEKEMQALRRQENIYQKLRREKAKGPQADSARIAQLQKTFEAAQKKAESYLKEGEFKNILERNGATNLNAYTSRDQTVYRYSLPANKAKLFFALESDRFMNPVLREFYTERDVVMEERRSRESNPVGRLVESFITTAFKAHPYGTPTIGHMSEIQNLSRTDAQQFFDKYYDASNLTIGIAGDVEPRRMKELAKKYFGRLPEGEDPLPVVTDEPKQQGERRVIIREQSRPALFVGYHRGSMHSKNAPVYDILSNVLTGGRTSRLYERLVEEEKMSQVQAIPSFPGSKYENLFVVFGFPSRGVSPDSVEHAVYDELNQIAEEGLSAEELERAKTQARDGLIGQLDSNLGLAVQFAQKQTLTGDWRNIFRDLEEIEAVTVSDVQRVARKTFKRSNRTVAMIKTKTKKEQPTASAE